MVDGPRARPAVSALRARGALDALQGATARPAPVRGLRRGRWSSPCRPARTWAPPTPSPPWTGSPSPPSSRIRPGRRRCRPGPRQVAAASLCSVGHGLGVLGGAGHPPHLLPLPHCGHGGFQPARGVGAGGPVCLHACEWALAGADGGGADWGGGDGDHGWGLWANCGHGLGEAEAGVGGRGMGCHARPCGEAAEGGGADVINVEGEDDAPPPPIPSARKRKGRPPPKGTPSPPPPPRKPRVRPPR